MNDNNIIIILQLEHEVIAIRRAVTAVIPIIIR